LHAKPPGAYKIKKSDKEDYDLIGVIFGEKGTGKNQANSRNGKQIRPERQRHVIFIDDDNSYMYDLSTKARFINAAEFGIATPKMLYGFLCGLAASDFDLETIYIDGLLSIIHHSLDTLEGLFAELKAFSEKYSLNIIMSITAASNPYPRF
jgi:hypothetical protein